jgi:ABC-type polysaccharide/polyol phosphate transport system ATPase subunit
MSSAVLASNLAKDYEVYARPADRLLEMLTFRQRHRKFPALRGVDFEIDSGESVGVIGQNGAGKSTLLKLISGVARPSRGALQVEGAVASILELGTGFHPEFSGKDNAALNAAILGLSPREISATLPRIFEFSELGSFLDRPVKTYSSGMYMRLAFSVAVSVEPDVLIIDEALAVGDGYFQKKCVDRIRQFQKSGRTILFCSHALYLVSTLCHRTLWLDEGRLMADGPSVDVVHDYETHLLEKNRRDASRWAGSVQEDVSFRDVEIVDDDGRDVEELGSGTPITIRCRVDADGASKAARVSVAVVRAADETRCCAVETPGDSRILPGRNGQEIAVRLDSLPLTRGDYGVVLVAQAIDDDALLGRCDVLPAFRIRGERFEVGVMRLEHDWNEEVTA